MRLALRVTEVKTSRFVKNQETLGKSQYQVENTVYRLDSPPEIKFWRYI